MDFFDQIINWISSNPNYAGLIVFFVSLAESLAFFGILIPGVVILFGVGALIGSDVLNFWDIYPWALAGAIIGDSISYQLGCYFDPSISKLSWFKNNPEYLKKGYDFFYRWGDFSVALGRFFGPIRAVIPFIAGLMKMPMSRFYTANILSAFAWALAYLSPGMILGHNSGIDNLGTWMIIALSLLIVVSLLVIINRFFKSP